MRVNRGLILYRRGLPIYNDSVNHVPTNILQVMAEIVFRIVAVQINFSTLLHYNSKLKPHSLEIVDDTALQQKSKYANFSQILRG